MSLFDENAAVLADITARGTKLDEPLQVDFAHIFPTEAAAEGFAAKAREEGFEAEVVESELTDLPWDVTVSRVMLPSCEDITVIEAHLDTMARAHGGQSDGWGFFST
jgi:hypothetical protein